jgi:hypothetical protein
MKFDVIEIIIPIGRKGQVTVGGTEQKGLFQMTSKRPHLVLPFQTGLGGVVSQTLPYLVVQ